MTIERLSETGHLLPMNEQNRRYLGWVDVSYVFDTMWLTALTRWP